MKVSSALAMFVAVLSANAWLTTDATTFTNLSPRFTCWGRLAQLEIASIGSSGVPVQVLEDSRPTRPAHFVAIPKSSLRSNALSACHGKCCHVFLCNFPFHYEKNYSSTVTIATKWRWCNTNIKRTSICFWVSFKHWPLSTSAHFLSANHMIRYVIQLRWDPIFWSLLSALKGVSRSFHWRNPSVEFDIDQVCLSSANHCFDAFS